MAERRPYRAVVFLASFLTFCLELSSAKLLLPRFGGADCSPAASGTFCQVRVAPLPTGRNSVTPS